MKKKKTIENRSSTIPSAGYKSLATKHNYSRSILGQLNRPNRAPRANSINFLQILYKYMRMFVCIYVIKLKKLVFNSATECDCCLNINCTREQDSRLSGTSSLGKR